MHIRYIHLIKLSTFILHHIKQIINDVDNMSQNISHFIKTFVKKLKKWMMGTIFGE